MINIDISKKNTTRKEYRHDFRASWYKILNSEEGISIEFREQSTRSFNNELGTYRKWYVFKNKKALYTFESFFSSKFKYTHTFTSPFNLN